MSTTTREKLLTPYVEGKNVLDIGSVGQHHHYNLWAFLKTNASRLTGIDTEPSDLPEVVQGNMEEYDFHRTFDVVIAGDVVEHLTNTGLFLANVRKHLVPNGQLVITTPNAKWWTVFFRPNPTHTLWYDRFTLTYVLKLCGFEIKYWQYYPGNKIYPWWLRPLVRRQALFFVATPTLPPQ